MLKELLQSGFYNPSQIGRGDVRALAPSQATPPHYYGTLLFPLQVKMQSVMKRPLRIISLSVPRNMSESYKHCPFHAPS